MRALLTLLLRLADSGGAPGASEVYAKVLEPAEISGSWIVRYTSLPPDADQRLRRLAGLP